MVKNQKSASTSNESRSLRRSERGALKPMLFPSRVRSTLALAALGVLASGNLFSLYPVTQVRKPDSPKPAAKEATADTFFPLETGYFWIYRAKIEIADDKG